MAKDTQPSRGGTHSQPLNHHARLSWAVRRLDPATKKHPQRGSEYFQKELLGAPKGGAGVFLPLWLLLLWQEPCLTHSLGPQPPARKRRQATGSALGPAGCMLGCENCCPGVLLRSGPAKTTARRPLQRAEGPAQLRPASRGSRHFLLVTITSCASFILSDLASH